MTAKDDNCGGEDRPTLRLVAEARGMAHADPNSWLCCGSRPRRNREPLDAGDRKEFGGMQLQGSSLIPPINVKKPQDDLIKETGQYRAQ